MSRLALYLLGPPRIELDDEPVHIGRRKALALLAYLALTPSSHRRDTLAALLWPDYDQSSARAHLRRALVSLTNRLGSEWFIADRESIGLNPAEAPWLDVDQFRRRMRGCEAHAHPEGEACPDCLALLTEATVLYRDDFMAGFSLPDSLPFDEWQRHESDALREDMGSVLKRLSALHAAQGEYEPAIAVAQRWLELDPLHEAANRRLMELYAYADRTSAALRLYETCRRLLKAELGVEPTTETTRLYERIRDGDIAAGEAVPVVPHNLPASLVPLVGREKELADIAKRLTDPACRLLTLIGPGGCGKTRLAIEAAATQIGNFRHGVYFVSLAPLEAADAQSPGGHLPGIVPAMAQALDFSFYTPTQDHAAKDTRQQLLDYLRKKHLLLLLDNFEHLLARLSAPSTEADSEAVNLVVDLLRTAPELKILVTSRTRLNARGEHLFPVPGMDVPEAVPIDTSEMATVAEFGAVKLFLQAARRAQPAFEPTADDLAQIVRICYLVHGMPLAILLAASWTGVLAPSDIVAHIADETDSGIAGIDFLVTDWGDVPQRQTSMRAVLDHSWRLLNLRQREVFRALSVFRGGFTREAAQHVTGASLIELRELAERSLLHPMPSGRYEVHELVRQYTAEKLERSSSNCEDVRDRHSAFFSAALGHWAVDLKGSRQQEALAEITADSENARAAWDWAVKTGNVARLDQAAEGLYLFFRWLERDREGETACRAALDALKDPASADGARVMAKLLVQGAAFNQVLGQSQLASQLLKESWDLLSKPELAGRDTRAEQAAVLDVMGQVEQYLGNYEEARQQYEKSLALCRSVGDRWATANVLQRLGRVMYDLSHYDAGKRFLEESLALRQALDDRKGMADSLRELSVLFAATGMPEEGERLARRSVAIQREIGNRRGVTEGLFHLAMRLMGLGRFADACPLLKETIATYDDLGMRDDYAVGLDIFGWAKTNLGLYDEAQPLYEESHALSRQIGNQHIVALTALGLGDIALAKGAFVDAAQLLEESTAIMKEIGQRAEEGLTLASLALSARGLGELSRARDLTNEALHLATETGAIAPSLAALQNIALLLVDAGEVERAVEIYALVTRHPNYGNSRFREDIAGKHIAAAAVGLPPEVVAAAQGRGQARDLWASAEELLEALE